MATFADPLNDSEKNGDDTYPGKNRAFSRTDTFSKPSFRRNTLEFGNTGGFARSVSNIIGITADSDEEWTRSLIGQYVKVDEKGVDGDVPYPAGFAREKR